MFQRCTKLTFQLVTVVVLFLPLGMERVPENTRGQLHVRVSEKLEFREKTTIFDLNGLKQIYVYKLYIFIHSKFKII